MPAGLEILNLHAQGGMAEVYRARATDANGRVWHYAVKRILPELIEDAETRRMFIEEQRVAACLVHDSIVRVYDVAAAEQAADFYIVMEFLEGKDLAEVIEAASLEGRTLPVWFAIHIAREVCRALHHATTEAKDKSGRILGLIHRDISPHNIFVCVDGQVKLTDFGVARVETAEVRTRAGIIKGKFGYMSPEQLMGGQLDFRSDLYNVGILLYEMLTAERLFHGETATQFVAAMMLNEIPPLAKKLLVPAELDMLMRRSLMRKREERPTTAAIFERDLEAIAAKFGLIATREHIAGEMSALFPEFEVAPPIDAEPAPDLAAEATVIRAPTTDAAPRRQPSRAGKLLTVMKASSPGPSPTPAAKAPVAPAAPAPAAPAASRATAAPPADELLATIIEKAPTAAELGLHPGDDEVLHTEQVRAFGGVSSTGPGVWSTPVEPVTPRRPRLPSQADPGDPGDDSSDGEAVTAETRVPASLRPSVKAPTAPAPAPATPAPPAPRPHRVSTGSRRVVSLEELDGKDRGQKPGKPK